jgi:two-component system cell cycle response regulator DivK
MPTPRVLIVDDNELNLRLAETLLSRAGFDVALARTAGEARTQLADERRRLDVVLMDLRLPDGNGLDVVREVRQNPRLQGLPVAAMTGSAIVSDPRQALDAGCDAYIPKPIDVDSFADEVRALAARVGKPA